MKTAMFGCVNFIIVIMTIMCVLHVCNFNSRSTNLQDNLQDAMTASLDVALNNVGAGYTISTTDELVADVVEGTALYLADGSALSVDVKQVNLATGIVSLSMTEYYRSPKGDITEVTCEQTVLLEQFNITS